MMKSRLILLVPVMMLAMVACDKQSLEEDKIVAEQNALEKTEQQATETTEDPWKPNSTSRSGSWGLNNTLYTIGTVECRPCMSACNCFDEVEIDGNGFAAAHTEFLNSLGDADASAAFFSGDDGETLFADLYLPGYSSELAEFQDDANFVLPIDELSAVKLYGLLPDGFSSMADTTAINDSVIYILQINP